MIHTLTAYGPDDHDDHGSRRVFGYYETRSEARRAVMLNTGSMEECLYTHLVIEAIAPGVHGEATEEEWFKWTSDREWYPCDRPAWAEGVVNHSMG